MEIYYGQIFLLLGQTTVVAILVLYLFYLRKKWGKGLLFAAIGLFQFLQVFLSSSVYLNVTDTFFISPGSAIFFTVSLFTVLIIYIKDDALETRRIIYALLITNIVITLLLLSFKLNVTISPFYNPLNISPDFFETNARILLVGTLVMAIDSLLIIVFFEFISRFIKPLFIRIFITMLLITSFDTATFTVLAFGNYGYLKEIFISALVSKGISSFVYSIFFTIYLKYFERFEPSASTGTLKDIFYTLSYRQKFEVISKEKEAVKKEAENAILLTESKYKTLTKISPVGIFMTDNDGKTIFVNPRWCEITGLSCDDAMGFGWHKALHPEEKEILLKNWSEASLIKKANYEEYRFIQPDGSEKWVLGQAVPDHDHEGKIIGYVGTITDITDLKLYEKDLKILKEKAEQSDMLKSAFLANMSHEIRTPMNGILGFTELLKDPDISEEEKNEYLELIEISGFRMMEIINNIVDISKIESGLTELTAEQTNIYTMCNDVYNFFEAEAKEKGLLLKKNNSEEFKNNLYLIDRNKTLSVLTNLIKNAIKYTDQGEIEFGYSVISENNQKLFKFYVKDTGIGIPEHRHEAIFQRFIQADITDRFARQGAGLGLSIAKAYVEMMNGKIYLKSEDGKGSEFIFTIPCNENITKSEDKTKSNNKTVKPGVKVLIAEDDLNSFLVYSSYLKDTEWEIIHVNTGVEALETAQKNPDLDLILMDIKMPLMDGYTAAKRIREFMPEIIIIAQSAFAFDPDKEEQESYFNQHITKPVDKKTFLETIALFFGV